MVPRFMPDLDHASKWFPTVMVPPVRPPRRTLQYWLKVLMPSIEGALYRVVS